MFHDFEYRLKEARESRAYAIGESLGDFINWCGRGIEFIQDQFQERGVYDTLKTPEEVYAYARSIRASSPGQADDLIAALKRAE